MKHYQKMTDEIQSLAFRKSKNYSNLSKNLLNSGAWYVYMLCYALLEVYYHIKINTQYKIRTTEVIITLLNLGDLF